MHEIMVLMSRPLTLSYRGQIYPLVLTATKDETGETVYACRFADEATMPKELIEEILDALRMAPEIN